jgi:hypothetical protein
MRALLIPLVTLSLATSSILGCSKDSPTTASPTPVRGNHLLEEPLLKKLPATTVGFLVSDLTGEGYQKFKTSPWFNEMPLQSAMQELERVGGDEAQKKMVEAISQFLKKLGALSPDGKSTVDQVLRSVVIVADRPSETSNEFDFAAYASAAGSTNLKEKLPVLRDALKEIGATLSDDTIAGAEGFAALLPSSSDEEEDAKPLSLHIGASEKLLGISDNKGLIQNLFAAQDTNGIDKLKELPEFKRAEPAVRGSEAPLFLGFAAAAKFLPAVKAATSQSKDASDQQESSPDLDFNPQDFPVDSVMISQGINKGIVTRGGIAVTAKTDTQRTIFGALSDGSLPSSAQTLPADMALALALDTKSIAKLEPLLKELEQSGAAASLPLIKTLKGLTIGIRNSDSGSPIPEIVLAFESEKRDDLAAMLESNLGEGMKMTGQEAMWMSKDIAGSSTRYFTTLLGVGLFISKPASSNTVLVTSSERAVKDILTSGTPKLQGATASGTKAGSLYLNFTEVANVMDSLKSSLAMFTGGASEMDKAFDSARFRNMGVSASTLAYQDGVFIVESTLEKPATK